MEALRFDRLSKSYGGGWLRGRGILALQNLDLAVEEGTAVGFVGPNGAGKSTTINLLMGLIEPTSGKALLRGSEPNRPEARSACGFLPENPAFPGFLSGAEVLALHGRLLGRRGGGLRRLVGALLERVGLSEAADRSVEGYSKGMVQRLGLALALLGDPPLLVLDEPMTGLDPVGRKEMRDLFLALRKEGKTLFFSTHILDDVERVCDRVAILDRGELLAEGPLSTILKGARRTYELTLGGVEPATRKALVRGVGGSIVPVEGGFVWTVQEPPPLEEALERLARRRIRVRSVSVTSGGLEEALLRSLRRGGRG